MRRAQGRHDPPSCLAVGAGVGLRLARGGALRSSGGQPGTAVGERAGGAVGGPRGAHQGAQFHERGVPLPGEFVLLGDEGLRSGDLVLAQVRGREGGAVEAAEHAPDVRVEHRGAAVVGEGDDRVRRVGADPRQCEEGVAFAGQFAGVALGDRDRALPQAQSPARVAQLPPGEDDLGGRGRGHLRRAGPALHPLPPRGKDPADGRLLAHDLAHEDRPRRGSRLAPWKRPRMAGVPGQEFEEHEPSVPHGRAAGGEAGTENAEDGE